MSNTFHHISVLLDETIQSVLPTEQLIENLKTQKENKITIVDATLGGAGHACALVKKFFSSQLYKDFHLHLVGIDQDTTALKVATQKLESLKTDYPLFKYSLFHENFQELEKLLSSRELTTGTIHGIYADFGVSSPQLDTQERGFSFLHEGPLDMRMDQTCKLTAETILLTYPEAELAQIFYEYGVYADFGVSSPQLDTQERGFSFLHEGPLDMRMDQTCKLTAETILLTYPEAELAQIFYEYGEEPKSRILARAILKDRQEGQLPLQNTKAFAEYVKKILKYGYSRTHPATRVFQALRIEVNNELGAIQTLLNFVPSIMPIYAHAAFISFHSLEDRLVKRSMRLWQEKGFGKESPRGGIIPTKNEIEQNPRARSARLRVFDFIR